jgi:adenylate cyclase
VIFHARQLWIAGVGFAWLVAALLVWGADAFNLRENIRELAFDRVLPLFALPPPQSLVTVVDIDSDSLARYGPWPWRRLVMADLLKKIAQSKPQVIGLDILLTEPDRLSPGGFVRNLSDAADRDDIAKLASRLPDGDAAVADALKSMPSVLGFVLDPAAGTPLPPGAPILTRGQIEAPDIWTAMGAIGPLPVIAAAGRGFGAIVLAADANGKVRRVPLLVAIDNQLRPGFAVEMLRVNYEASSFILDASPQRLRIGPLLVPIDADAALRILPRPATAWSERTIPAWRILDDEASRARLTGRIVLIGSGAPEVGGLRATPVSATTPSVQIQADALANLVGGSMPRRPYWVSKAEIFGAAALCLIAIALAIFRRPIAATVLVGLLCAIWVAGTVMSFIWEHLLIDIAGPPAIAGMVFAATALSSYAQNERLVRALRRRFEQHLAPDVVKRLVDAPNMLRLSGESREVTAMFTDIEGFTALTDRSDAGEVLRLLDDYLTAVTDIVVAHGGMVDKLIGDGVFALFNAPLDLDDHTRRAVAAAKAIIAATENYRKTPLAVKLALGRTRIGIETGMAIVGDVGGGSRLDYTALGNVVNTASRLQGVNKEFKTSICIGPTAASTLGPREVERLGAIEVRGRSTEMEVFTVARVHEEKASPGTRPSYARAGQAGTRAD